MCAMLGKCWEYLYAYSTSHSVQVAISIQSLILVDQPYFNEPGYEAEMNTDAGRRHSSAYNAVIR